MAALYLPDADDGLSAAALALSPERLQNEASAAERALGLKGTSFSDAADISDAKKAVALQVNLQIRTIEGRELVGEQKGDQSKRWERTNKADQVSVDPLAEEIVDQLLGASARTRSVVTENYATW